MKKLITIILVIISTNAFSQKMLILPDTPRFANQNKGTWVLRLVDTSAWYSNGTRWVRSLNTNDLTGINFDSTSLSNRVNLKLNISDTGNMLTNYLRSASIGYGLFGNGKTITPLYVDSGSVNGLVSKTRLNNSLNTKQDLLVSGTNIKTVNGNSLLGSGDLVVSGGQTDTLAPSKGLLLGNSTVAAYDCHYGIDYYLMTKSDSAVGTTITNLAVPGHTIGQQQTIWNADPNKATYDWIIVEVGLNDCDSASANTAEAITARLQLLIDAINSQKKQSAVVLISAMTPAKQRYIDLFGTIAGANCYAKWQYLNNAIMGGLPGRITGVKVRIDKASKLLNDGYGNLLQEYDCGDHVHQNNAAAKIMASAWREQLNYLGFLKVETPLQIITPIPIIASFGGGGGNAGDTTIFNTTTIYGSFYNSGTDSLIITSMVGVLQGTSPSVTYKVFYNDSLNVEAGATALVTAGNNLISRPQGTTVTTFDNNKIPPNVWVWVKTSTVTTKPTYFSLSLIGYRKKL